jgi:predicted ester cyclase
MPLLFTLEKSGRHAMSAGENKALVRRLLERVRDGWSPAVIEEFFAPSYRRHLNPTTAPLTREGQRARANRLRAAFPDATVTLEDIFAEGDRVAYRLTIRATHQGAFQGIPPTGKQVTVSFTAIVRIEDGRLVEEWGGLDLFDLRRQLEAVVTAGPDSKRG